MNPFLGVFLHTVDGLSVGSSYLPLRRIRQWTWGGYWLAQSFVAWIIFPWLVAFATTPNLFKVLENSLPWDFVGIYQGWSGRIDIVNNYYWLG